MAVLLVLTLFSFTEKSNFSSSTTYTVIEMVAVFSVIGAAGSEFLALLSSAFETIAKCCFYRKRKVAPKTAPDEKVAGQEGFASSRLETENIEINRLAETEEPKKMEKKIVKGNPSEFGYNPFTVGLRSLEEVKKNKTSRIFGGENVNGGEQASRLGDHLFQKKGKKRKKFVSFGAGSPRKSKRRIKRPHLLPKMVEEPNKDEWFSKKEKNK